jgi:hypothetical protein
MATQGPLAAWARFPTSIILVVILGACSISSTPTATPGANSTPRGALQASVREPRVLGRAASSGNEYIFVSNDTQFGRGGTAEIDYWPVGTNGNVAPTVIGGSNTGLSYGLEGVVLDSSGQIFVNSSYTGAILGFPPNSSGNVSPTTKISGANTTLVQPIGLAIDDDDNLYVADCGSGCGNGENGPPSIDVFQAGANGDVAPVRRIVGKRTGLIAPFGIAVRKGRIYVADIAEQPPLRGQFSQRKASAAFAIDVFGPDANGNVKPHHKIIGPNTELSQPAGIAVARHGIYTTVWDPPAIQRFPLHANGDVPPRATIEGSRTKLKCCLDGIITARDETVYVVERGTPEIAHFAMRRKGKQRPLSIISGSKTRLYIPLFVYVGLEPASGLTLPKLKPPT